MFDREKYIKVNENCTILKNEVPASMWKNIKKARKKGLNIEEYKNYYKDRHDKMWQIAMDMCDDFSMLPGMQKEMKDTLILYFKNEYEWLIDVLSRAYTNEEHELVFLPYALTVSGYINSIFAEFETDLIDIRRKQLVYGQNKIFTERGLNENEKLDVLARFVPGTSSLGNVISKNKLQDEIDNIKLYTHYAACYNSKIAPYIFGNDNKLAKMLHEMAKEKRIHTDSVSDDPMVKILNYYIQMDMPASHIAKKMNHLINETFFSDFHGSGITEFSLNEYVRMVLRNTRAYYVETIYGADAVKVAACINPDSSIEKKYDLYNHNRHTSCFSGAVEDLLVESYVIANHARTEGGDLSAYLRYPSLSEEEKKQLVYNEDEYNGITTTLENGIALMRGPLYSFGKCMEKWTNGQTNNEDGGYYGAFAWFSPTMNTTMFARRGR